MGTYVYAGCLALGGVLLAASVFLGHGGGADGDAGGDAGGPDAGVGHDVGDAHHGGEHGGSGVVSALMSLRFWTFFLAFFGLTGLALRGLGLAGEAVAAVAASCVGLVSGGGIAFAMRKLGRGPDTAARDTDYVGKSARVLVPVTRSGTGKVRVQVKGTTVDLLATTDEDADFEASDEVLVVDMDGTRAKVARVKVD